MCCKDKREKINYNKATTLTSWHLMVTYCSLHVAQHFNFFESKAVDMNTVMLFGILNGVSIGFLNLSLGFNSIGFYQMTKLAIIPFTVLLETIFLKKQFSQKIKFSLFLLLVGVGIASITDLQLNFVGAILSLLAIITTCVGQILTNTIQKQLNVSSTQLLYQSAPFQAAILFVSGPWVDQCLTKQNVFAHKYSPIVLGFIILSCLIAVSVNFSTFLVIGKTSPVTYQVLGHLKTCLVLAFGYTLLHDPFTSRNIIGILIAILGMALYSYFCSHEKKKKQLVDLSPPSQDPIRSAIIDSCIRVTDNGRESIQRKVFFIFTLYNTSNHNDQLKLGASSPEEAAQWIHNFQEAALKADQNPGDVGCPRSDWQSLRLKHSNRAHHMNSIDWTICSYTHMDPMSSDVIAPSTWTIFGCQNGLRLFKEAKDREYHGKWDDHPAIMAVGVVDGTSEAIFKTLMSLGPSRSEWDFCFYKGSVIEHIDGHTDIVHKLLNIDWLPWGMKRRDLLLQRYWRREDDGTYVILYHSVSHKNCPPQKSYVRACLKSGGYVVSPMNQGKQSVVKHMIAIDWKFWKSYLQASSARSITIHMLGRVAALRELFRAKVGDYPSLDLSSGELTREIKLPLSVEDIKVEVQTQAQIEKTNEDMEEEKQVITASEYASLVGLDDAADEFFDVSEPLDYDQSEDDWCSDFGAETYSQDTSQPKLLTAAGFVKKLHDIAVQKRGYVDLQEMGREETVSWYYGTTLPKDPTCGLPCSWTAADPSTFLICGETYLDDHKKIKSKGTLMQMVAADWLRSDKREDDLGDRPGSIVQKFAAKDGPEFFFIVNIQVPGSTTYSLALYYMMNTPVQNVPLLESFIRGDDAYRNSRFKLIPYISKGSWIVKQSVGKKACLVGQALEINYFHGKNYLELGIDIGSSTVARGVVSLVIGYLNNLVIEMAFLIQANTHDELPEHLLGTCRLNHLDVSKAVSVKP